MTEKAHCKQHEEFDRECTQCRFARLVQIDLEDRQCICPIFRPTPGGCPVHGG